MASSRITVEQIHRQVRDVLKQESRIYPLRLSGDYEKQTMILLNHWQNKRSVDSARLLVKLKRERDVTVTGRSILESVLNMGLMLHLPKADGISRYRQHVIAESLEIYKHMVEVDKGTANILYETVDIALWEDEVKQIETKSSKINSPWSGKNILDVCKLLDVAYPSFLKIKPFFEFLYYQIYCYGSSSIRTGQLGRLWDIRFTSGLAEGGRTAKVGRLRERSLVFNYFYSLIAFIASMRMVGKAFEIPLLESFFQMKVGSLLGEYLNYKENM